VGAVEIVRRQLEAFDAGDVDALVSGLSEDVRFEAPGFWLGAREYRGREAVRESFEQAMELRSNPDRDIKARTMRYFVDRADERKVLVEISIEVFELNAARSFGTDAAILHVVEDGLVTRTRTWTTLEEGLAALADPVEA
jgi:ketosteroid isomerase-like protein